MIPLLVLACMCVVGFPVVIGMGFARCDSVFSIAFPFPNSHGGVLLYLVELNCQMDSKLNGVVS